MLAYETEQIGLSLTWSHSSDVMFSYRVVQIKKQIVWTAMVRKSTEILLSLSVLVK